MPTHVRSLRSLYLGLKTLETSKPILDYSSRIEARFGLPTTCSNKAVSDWLAILQNNKITLCDLAPSIGGMDGRAPQPLHYDSFWYCQSWLRQSVHTQLLLLLCRSNFHFLFLGCAARPGRLCQGSSPSPCCIL